MQEPSGVTAVSLACHICQVVKLVLSGFRPAFSLVPFGKIQTAPKNERNITRYTSIWSVFDWQYSRILRITQLWTRTKSSSKPGLNFGFKGFVMPDSVIGVKWGVLFFENKTTGSRPTQPLHSMLVCCFFLHFFVSPF